MSYTSCPCCSSENVRADHLIENGRTTAIVPTCSDCSAVFGNVGNSTFRNLVRRPMSTKGAVKYFDFTDYVTNQRSHGWYAEDGRIAQYG